MVLSLLWSSLTMAMARLSTTLAQTSYWVTLGAQPSVQDTHATWTASIDVLHTKVDCAALQALMNLALVKLFRVKEKYVRKCHKYLDYQVAYKCSALSRSEGGSLLDMPALPTPWTSVSGQIRRRIP